MQGFSTLAWYWQAVLVTNRRLVFLHSEKYAKVTQVLNKWRESAWTEKRKFRVLMLVRGMDDAGTMPITMGVKGHLGGFCSCLCWTSTSNSLSVLQLHMLRGKVMESEVSLLC